MTQDEIIQMACNSFGGLIKKEERENFLSFAKLVVAEEREACAKVCDDIDAEYEGQDVLATWCSKAIRARGEA